MKKRHTVAGIVMSALVLGSGALIPLAKSNPAHAEALEEECYLINSNQISITKSQYDLFQQMGFKEYEIDQMTKSKFDKLTAMNIVKTVSEVSVMDEDDEVPHIGINNCLTNLLGNLNPTASTLSNNNGNYCATDGKKVLYTFVSLAEVSNGYRIFVKQNLEWRSEPDKRYTDILAIKYTNHIRLTETNGIPDIEMQLWYIENLYGPFNSYLDCEVKSKKYTGKDYDVCDINPGNHVAFKCSLPLNIINNGSYYTQNEVMSVSMESTFITNESTLTGTEMNSYYAHQTSSGSIDWGTLSFSATPPFISYQTSIIDRTPEYDMLFSHMSIDFGVDMPRC